MYTSFQVLEYFAHRPTLFLKQVASYVDYEQSLFFFRFSKDIARARAFSHARGHLRVSGVLLDGPRKKRDCS